MWNPLSRDNHNIINYVLYHREFSKSLHISSNSHDTLWELVLPLSSSPSSFLIVFRWGHLAVKLLTYPRSHSWSVVWNRRLLTKALCQFFMQSMCVRARVCVYPWDYTIHVLQPVFFFTECMKFFRICKYSSQKLLFSVAVICPFILPSL